MRYRVIFRRCCSTWNKNKNKNKKKKRKKGEEMLLVAFRSNSPLFNSCCNSVKREKRAGFNTLEFETWCDDSPVRWLVKAVVGMRSGFPSSSSPLPANVAMLGCWGGFGFAGVAACFLQSAINTPVTISPNPVAVPPSPIRIGDMSTEDADSPAKPMRPKRPLIE